MTLLNIFDMFDFDCDGVLSRNEYGAFSLATADTPPDDEVSQFDTRADGITMAGFLFMHECEAFSGDDLAVPDIWESLYRLGYDNSLQLHYVCCTDKTNSWLSACFKELLRLLLTAVTRNERDQILRGLYYRGRPDDASAITAHIFTTEYFGMMIVRNTNGDTKVRTLPSKPINHNLIGNSGEAFLPPFNYLFQNDKKKTYRVEIIEEMNVEWNFFLGRDDIDPKTYGDWVSSPTPRPFPAAVKLYPVLRKHSQRSKTDSISRSL
ncbi:unnamed protein product [Haemonchus placei]|uniref:EF-hand domain-containing protein n=1 Tax=Haemonchus placei TaxID=6290 RepID=A0A0N4X7F9_HAEPC|nr:unnamed protein product [Haemonchus placei]